MVKLVRDHLGNADIKDIGLVDMKRLLLQKKLFEEVGEVVEAMEHRDDDKLRDELGDLVQLAMQVAAEADIPWIAVQGQMITKALDRGEFKGTRIYRH